MGAEGGTGTKAEDILVGVLREPAPGACVVYYHEEISAPHPPNREREGLKYRGLQIMEAAGLPRSPPAVAPGDVRPGTRPRWRKLAPPLTRRRKPWRPGEPKPGRTPFLRSAQRASCRAWGR